MQKTIQQKPITSNEVSGIGSPITAWAVEIEGKIDPDFVFNNRATARHVRNTGASGGLYKKISVRKINLVPVPGR
mgnify:FL=1